MQDDNEMRDKKLYEIVVCYKIRQDKKRFIRKLTVGFHIQSYIHIQIDCVRFNIS